ncbi:MAG: RDD family protein, partial [Flavobacteriales bacterium]|nr:RDD family protein [Flavobacteriales bacterium]
MNKIEITTTQNVTVEYELSPLIYRINAFILDGVILTIGCLILWGITAGIFGRFADLAIYFTVLPVALFYSLAFEHFNNGQSIGK